MPRYKTPKLLTKHIEAILKHYAEYPIPRLLTKHVPELRGCAGMDVLRAIRQLQAQGMLPKSRKKRGGDQKELLEQDELSDEDDELDTLSPSTSQLLSISTDDSTTRASSRLKTAQMATQLSSSAGQSAHIDQAHPPSIYLGGASNQQFPAYGGQRDNQAMNVDNQYLNDANYAALRSPGPYSLEMDSTLRLVHNDASQGGESVDSPVRGLNSARSMVTASNHNNSSKSAASYSSYVATPSENGYSTPKASEFAPSPSLSLNLPLRAELTRQKPTETSEQGEEYADDAKGRAPVVVIPTGGPAIAKSPALPKSLIQEFVLLEPDPFWKQTPVIDLMAPHPYVQCLQDEFQGFVVLIGPFYPGTTTSLNFVPSQSHLRVTIYFPDHHYDPRLPLPLLRSLDAKPAPFYCRVRVPLGIYWGHIEINELESYTAIQFYHVRCVENPNEIPRASYGGSLRRKSLPPADGKMRIFSVNKTQLLPVDCLDLPT